MLITALTDDVDAGSEAVNGLSHLYSLEVKHLIRQIVIEISHCIADTTELVWLNFNEEIPWLRHLALFYCRFRYIKCGIAVCIDSKETFIGCDFS